MNIRYFYQQFGCILQTPRNNKIYVVNRSGMTDKTILKLKMADIFSNISTINSVMNVVICVFGGESDS